MVPVGPVEPVGTVPGPVEPSPEGFVPGPGVGLPLGTDGPPVPYPPYPVTCDSVVLHLQNFFFGKHLAAGFVSGLGGAETGAKVTGGSVGSSVTSP